MANSIELIKGKLFYASVHKVNRATVNEDNPGGNYTLEIAVDDATSSRLKDLGLKPARHGETKDFAPVRHEGAGDQDVFRFKRNKILKDGTDIGPPVVVDAKNNPVTDLLGNGTVANVKVKVYDYSFKGKKGTSGSIMGVQVVDLVPYTPKSMFSETKGFVASDHESDNSPKEEVPF